MAVDTGPSGEEGTRQRQAGSSWKELQHSPPVWVGLAFCLHHLLFFFLVLVFFNVYLFLTERQSISGGGAEREGDTESKAGSRL